MHYDFDLKSYILDVPTECPKCGNPLELNNEYDSAQLICTNNDCDYELDVTEELKEYELQVPDEDSCE